MKSEDLKVEENNLGETSFRDLVSKFILMSRYLSQKWMVIFALGLFGGLLGIAYSILKRPNYTATTTFVLEEGGASGASALGSLGGIASMVGLDLGSGGGLFTGDNILELYKSRRMIEQTLLTSAQFPDKNQLLIERFIESNKLRNKWDDVDWRNINFHDANNFNITEDSIITEIVKEINKKYLQVTKPDKKLSILKVELKSKDQFFAKLFSDEIVKSVNQFYVQTKTKRSKQNVDILQEKTDSVRTVMNAAIGSAAAANDATPNLNTTRLSQRVAPVQRSQFLAETNKAVLGELVKNLELSKISLLKETPLIQIIDVPTYPLEKDKVGKVKGFVIGGLLFGCLTIFVLFVKKLIKEALR